MSRAVDVGSTGTSQAPDRAQASQIAMKAGQLRSTTWTDDPGVTPAAAKVAPMRVTTSSNSRYVHRDTDWSGPSKMRNGRSPLAAAAASQRRANVIRRLPNGGRNGIRNHGAGSRRAGHCAKPGPAARSSRRSRAGHSMPASSPLSHWRAVSSIVSRGGMISGCPVAWASSWLRAAFSR